MKKPEEVHDELEALEARMRYLSSTNKQLIDALVEAHEAIKCWLDMNECDCEDGVHICGRPKRRRQLDKIKTALRDAGVES